jgi:hypothetical protein
MIIVLGLLILVAALVVGVAGVVSNVGHGHALLHGFAVFGYHVTGSTGALFLYGVVVGAVAVLGLSLLLTGARRTSRRGHIARGELAQSRQETADVSHSRDSLIDERDGARAENSATRRISAAPDSGPIYADSRRRVFGGRPHEEATAEGPPPDIQPHSTRLDDGAEQVEADEASPQLIH